MSEGLAPPCWRDPQDIWLRPGPPPHHCHFSHQWVSRPGRLWTLIVVFLALQPSNSLVLDSRERMKEKGMRKNKKRKCERRAGRRKSRRQIRAHTSPANPGFFFFFLALQENPKPEKSMEVAISVCEHNSRDKSMAVIDTYNWWMA